VGAAGLGDEGGGRERRGDDEWSGRDGGLPVELEIPDDARELDPEVRAYRRQLRRSRMRVRLRRLLFTRRWNRYGLSGPLVTAILLLVAIVGSLTILLGPRFPGQPPRAPLATNPSAAPGEVGGLLPPISLTIAGRTHDVRTLRPAVLALVPPDCRCEGTLDALFGQAKEYGLSIVLVGGSEGASALRQLRTKVGNGTAPAAEDEGQRLAAAYRVRGVTAVLVRADGVVIQVHRDLTPRMRLEPDLAQLSRPAAGSAR